MIIRIVIEKELGRFIDDLAVPLDLDNDCEITENGFHLANKFDPAIKNIGLSVTVGNGGIQKHECFK